jgi:capsular polysaccharide biosynthesis protein
MRAALEWLLPEGSSTIVVPHLSPWRVQRLWIAPTPSYMYFYPSKWTNKTWTGIAGDAKRFATLLAIAKARAPAAALAEPGPELLFLARQPHLQKKKLVNRIEIETIARSHGFQIVYPESLTFLDQVRIAHQAKFVIAPEGSNSLLAFFCRAGARVCLLSSPHTFPLVDVNGILTALGVDLTILTGALASDDPDWSFWNDYHINPADFERFLKEWVPGGKAA